MRLRQTLRSQFRSQYLGQLRQQSIKIYNTQPIKVDEIVLLEDNNKRRSYWNLARVLKVIPGRDGQIRIALIKTENSELLRPVQRLYRLELENPVVKTGDEPIPLTTSSGRVVKTPAK
ncbi:integrase catalytic domain-containing protein [Nephila pilipes]|uniref:Integrase catalytic domain-containing protein n=1 Tax=Nephila pilipes TaxID=299642 RepID=A0A8X6U8N2_NEPPI|nr:integrase catalytic domain-containing protein [Nephila pilipes]